MEIGGQDIIVTTVLEKKDQVKAIHDIIKDVCGFNIKNYLTNFLS